MSTVKPVPRIGNDSPPTYDVNLHPQLLRFDEKYERTWHLQTGQRPWPVKTGASPPSTARRS
jgi:hypothetical protein